MEQPKVAIIGAGPSGILAADKILGSKVIDASVTIYEAKSQSGGIPYRYSEVAPNSPYHDLYKFLKELKSEKIFSERANEDAIDILNTAVEDPTLGKVYESIKLIEEDLIFPDNRSSRYVNAKVKKINERNGRYELTAIESGYGDWSEEFDVVISAIGGKPKENPYKNISLREIPLENALSKHYYTFGGEKTVIIGASHSGAIAFINAVNQNAKEIEVWYKDEKFKEHFIDENNIKHFQFSGVNDPTLSELKDAMASFEGKYRFRSAEEISECNENDLRDQYREWAFVSATGFKKPKIEFYDESGNCNELDQILEGDTFAELPPNLLNPVTGNPIPRVYGLGLAYPLTFKEGYLENTVEKPDAKIVGIYFTNELSKLIVPDILKSFREGQK